MNNHEISVKGKILKVPSISIHDSVVVVKGKLIKKAEIFDEYWCESNHLPNYLTVLEEISQRSNKPDIFTFTQRIPDTEIRYEYHAEWVNYAVIILNSYDTWINNQISNAAKRNIKASVKRGVEVRVCEFDNDYVKGIMSIYNETPIRQGRKFWHYEKCFDAVQAENGTYKSRSTYLGAYYEGEMIGYLKIVWDENSAGIMQILSKINSYNKRPNDALLAEAVKQCCTRGIKYLIYENFVYGRKAESSLTDFKRGHGFTKMDVPQYFVPLTLKGFVALRLGLHKSFKEIVPFWLTSRLLNIRAKCYERSLLKT
ncbi:hypothetical protein [Methylobacter psychrophilus]|uniref:hypothetical protein n=1 Tax=Methylobacter psychrophilus TaxID=96941 RepID=UPI0021D507FC|nr:hypothetical protein [Methylobacter psychrophilus]